MKPRVHISQLEESMFGFPGNNGICVACGSEQGGVEPDAERYPCESCGKRAVYGIEQAVILQLVDVDE